MPLSNPKYHKGVAGEENPTQDKPHEEGSVPKPLDATPFSWPQALERPGLSDLPFLFKALEKRVTDLEVRAGLSPDERTAVTEAAQAGAVLDLKFAAHAEPERHAALDRMMHVEKEMVKVQAQRSRAVQELQEERAKEGSHVRLEQLHHAKENIFDERISALQNVHRAEQERAQITNEKEQVKHQMEKYKVMLKKAKPGDERVHLEIKMKQLEADLGAKVALSKGLDAALAKVSEAEQERARIYSENEHRFAELEWRKKYGSTQHEIVPADMPKDATEAKLEKLAIEFRQESSFMHDMTSRLQLRLSEMSEMLEAVMRGENLSKFPRSTSHHSKQGGPNGRDERAGDLDPAARAAQMSDVELLVRVREGLGDIGSRLNQSSSRLNSNDTPALTNAGR
mmetsp:Transcript_27699/g.50832  ORF Transcript_27699/g.50832 Transcript_27699/m.50832 type:complete len:397 (+) Transcript_27699:13-1203(+)